MSGWNTEDYEWRIEELQAQLSGAKQRIGELETLNAERNRQNALAFEERDRLRALIQEHNAGCDEVCGTGDQEAARCGWRQYLPRRCPDCPRDWWTDRRDLHALILDHKGASNKPLDTDAL